MPSVRFSRDKRGYEYVYLVHTPTRRGKPGRSRVLYWYRTPPGVRIGRKPFDEEVRRTLEQQNPGVTFDWDAIVNTPMPPPDMTEYWRERRKAEKAAKIERRAMEAEDTAVEEPDAEAADVAAVVSLPEPLEEAANTSPADGIADGHVPAADGPAGEGQAGRKRRRRRGGRRRRVQGSETDVVGAPGSEADEGDGAGPDESAAAVQSDAADSPSEEE